MHLISNNEHMTLTPTFSVTPHGIKRFNSGSGVVYYAVFKILSAAAELEDSSTSADATISADDWNNFVKKVNLYTFSYQYNSNVLTIAAAAKPIAGYHPVTFSDPDDPA